LSTRSPPESLFIIGSNSVNNPGELYIIDINSISKSLNKRNKRLIDLVFSFVFFVTSPLLILFQNNPSGLCATSGRCLQEGNRGWVITKPVPEKKAIRV
jgi:hypothetical protein